jgi:recombination protein RecA
MPKEKLDDGGLYFEAPKKLEFISSGSTLLDLVMGGGYPVGRITNIVGDRSSGKSLLAIEATSTFAKQYPNGRIRYIEVESAFDIPYAERLGLPVDRVEFNNNAEAPIFTVEDVYKDMETFLKELDPEEPGLYILDSLDALSDKAELDRDITDGTYGAGKAKKMSEMFRRLVQHLENKRVALIVISQIRDKMGFGFGEKYARSGGRALDFYASIVMNLVQVGRIKKTVKSVERVVGVNVRALNKKNKISLPFRECDFEILFEYGTDDLSSCLNYLKKENLLEKAGSDRKTITGIINEVEDLDDDAFSERVRQIRQAVQEHWESIEQEFKPKRRKV